MTPRRFARDLTTTRTSRPPKSLDKLDMPPLLVYISISSSSSSSANGSSSGKSPTVTLSGRTKLARSGPVSKYRFPSTLRAYSTSVSSSLQAERAIEKGCRCVSGRKPDSRAVVLADWFIPLDANPHTPILRSKLGRPYKTDGSSTLQLVRERDLTPSPGDEVGRDRWLCIRRGRRGQGEATELISLLVG
jgi:hypothetical protein